MKARYYTLAGGAILFGSALLALQIVGGLEYTSGQSPFNRWSMVAAMVTVAILPVFIDLVVRVSKLLAACLLIGFISFLAYSLPASIGRVGEIKEAKVLAADDAATLKAQLADVRKTLLFAEPDMERECVGSPTPLPTDVNRWPECRRKRGSVTAFRNERARLETALASMGTARLGDTSSQMLAWAFAPLGISEETIRKGSGMALPIGLEVVIFSLFGVASVAIRRAGEMPRQAVKAAQPVEAESEPLELQQPPSTPPPGGARRKLTRDEALADLRLLAQAGQTWESQDELCRRWGYDPKTQKGSISRWFDRWERTGQLPGSRVMVGRCKTLASAD